MSKDQNIQCGCNGDTGSHSQSCCGEPDSVNAGFKGVPWITGHITVSEGEIPAVSTRLTFGDILGSWKARWDIGRMDYKIPPGLYAVGIPDNNSPVLVSANYKMSFDRLRRELAGFNLWILVLDTKGVNVWCAAGKGTFGTQELINRIARVRLQNIVTHRKLILPQLGAPGIAAHEVLKLSGFKVIYGPVRAKDLPAFLNAGNQATPEMREVRFGIIDRMVLAPVELVGAIKPALIVIAVLFGMNLIMNGSAAFYTLLFRTLADFLPFLGAILTGVFLVPAFLPYIPGRALSFKGWLLGLLWAGAYLWLISHAAGWKQITLYLLLLPPITSFLAMNFTGTTTYTSLSGVVKEMKVAVPAQIISAGLGIVFMIAKMFIRF